MDKIHKLLRLLIVISSVFFICCFIFVAFSRISYPFELEWMEGGSVVQLDMIMQGRSIYCPPSIEYIPQIYTPFYYIAAIPFAKIFGIGLFPLRLLSVLSTFGCIIILFLFVKRETKSNFYGLISSGVFAATFFIGGEWFDLARVDMLFMFMYLLSLFFLRGALCDNSKSAIKKINKRILLLVLSAIFAFLSFFTKQSALLLYFPVSLYLLIYERKQSWYFNVPFYLLILISTIYLSMQTKGWYYFWNFSLPAEHHWTYKVFFTFWAFDLIKPMSIVLILLIIYLINNKNSENKSRILFFVSVLIGSVICSYSSRLHYGGFNNVLIPVYTILCIFLALGFHQIQENLSENKKEEKGNFYNINRQFSILLMLVVFFQFLTLIYSPRIAIPTKEDEKAGWNLISRIKNFKGDVWFPGHQYLCYLAGKKSYAHGLLIWDLIENSKEYNKDIEQELLTALNQHRFDAIISYTYMEKNYPPFLEFYKSESKAIGNDAVFWSRTGFYTRPENIYVPK